MEDSIFTKIIKGEIPAHKVYEDDKTLAILDIYPIQPGQVLVFPKVQVDHFMDLPDEDYQALWSTVKKVAQKLKQTYTNKDRVAVIVEGLEVAHAHVKVFPFTTDDEFRRLPDKAVEPDHAAYADLAEKLKI